MNREYAGQVRFELEREDEDLYSHTWQEEQRILDMIRLGNGREAIRLSEEMDSQISRLAPDEKSHWRNVAIVSVTLGARAAIEGGLSPGVAYHVSDYYIVRASEARDRESILACRAHAIEDLTLRVRNARKKKTASVYVERCKDYVEQHFREKIYLDQLAEQLGISGGYLSRLFKKETGMCLQDYINDIRVHRAAHLLVYSDEPLPKIAAYVNFPSQSYFGRLFKAKTGKTPRQYREEKRTQI